MLPTAWYPLLPAASLTAGSQETLQRLGSTWTARKSHDGEYSVLEGQQARPHRVVNDLLFAWSGSEEPSYEVTQLQEVGSTEYTAVLWKKLRPFATTIENVMRDVVDNAHFEPVHRLYEADTRAWQDGSHLRTRSQGIIDASRFGGPRLRGHLLMNGRVHGPGLLTYQATLTMGIQLSHILLSAAVPVDEEHVQMYVGVSLRKIPLPGVNRFLLRRFLLGLEADYLADAEYWESDAGRMQPEPSDAVEEELYKVFDAWFSEFAPAQVA